MKKMMVSTTRRPSCRSKSKPHTSFSKRYNGAKPMKSEWLKWRSASERLANRERLRSGKRAKKREKVPKSVSNPKPSTRAREAPRLSRLA